MSFNLSLKPHPGKLFFTMVRSGKMAIGSPNSLKMGWFVKLDNKYISLNAQCPNCGSKEIFHNTIVGVGDKCTNCSTLVEDFISLTE